MCMRGCVQIRRPLLTLVVVLGLSRASEALAYKMRRRSCMMGVVADGRVCQPMEGCVRGVRWSMGEMY